MTYHRARVFRIALVLLGARYAVRDGSLKTC
jgi:hypothetical protein